MKRIFFYIVLSLFFLGWVKKCNSNKKKEGSNQPIQLIRRNISTTISYNQLEAINKNIFGLNTGFIWADEIDKNDSFVSYLNQTNNIVLRFPGGSIANFYHSDKPGYGFRIHSRIGKKGLQLMKQTKDRKENILENFIALCHKTNAKALFCASIYEKNENNIFYVIDRLKEENIEIIGIELGNELNLISYRNDFPNAELYIQQSKELIHAIRTKYPSIPIGLVAEALFVEKKYNKRNQFMHDWNKGIATADFDAYIIHSYFESQHFGKKLPFDKIHTDLVKKTNPYKTNYVTNVLNYFKSIEKTPKKIWITEWGLFNEYVENTLYQATLLGQFLNSIIKNDTAQTISIANFHSIGTLLFAKPKGTYNKGTCYYAYQYLSNIVIQHNAYYLRQPSIVDSNLVVEYYYNPITDSVYCYFINPNKIEYTLTLQQTPNSKTIDYIYGNSLAATNHNYNFYQKEYPNRRDSISHEIKKLTTSAVSLKPYSLGVISFKRK